MAVFEAGARIFVQVIGHIVDLVPPLLAANDRNYQFLVGQSAGTGAEELDQYLLHCRLCLSTFERGLGDGAGVLSNPTDDKPD